MAVARAFAGVVGALAVAMCAPVETAPMAGEVEITLARSACYGFCPDYTVTISGTGEVRYVGRAFVSAVGEQHARITPEEVMGLITRFDAIGFDRLRDTYRAQVSDLPTYTLTLERNGRRKAVVDYGGLSAGMPETVRALQDEVDRVAGTARWVLRDGEPVRTRAEP